jgi:hypothetical protein
MWDIVRYLIFLFIAIAEEYIGPGILGSICTWTGCLDTALFLSTCSCVVTDHLCGETCKLSGRRGCLEDCIKVGSDNVIFEVPGTDVHTGRGTH